MNDQQVLNSIFRIQSRVDSGTCFLFGDKRHVLTAKHVIVAAGGDVAGDIVVEIEPGKSERAIHWQLFGSFDIALGEFANDLAGTPLEPAAVAGDPTPGAEFRAAGFPINITEKWQPGKLVGRVKRGEYEIRFEHTYSAQLSGLSGGPALDAKNRVLGVVIEHDFVTASAGKMVPLADFQAELDLSARAAAFSCLAIFSDNESTDGVLRTAVREAIEILAVEWDQKIDLIQHQATDCVSTRENYIGVVRSICRADVCIFDLTGYEPAMMLLLGIRSVVKRGMTIGSTSSNIENAPYDIKELSLLSHAQATAKGLKLRNVISERIRVGRAAQSLQHYLDLPTFDAVRNLPRGRRSEVLPKEHVLLLSSYNTSLEANFEYIQDRLQFELQKRKIEDPNIWRVIDLNARSPWLVSQNMYEAIRRTKLCIVDWTGFDKWPANVFFELGVRISVRDSVTFCLLADASGPHKETVNSQQKNLIALFNPVRYQPGEVKGEQIAAMMARWDHFAEDGAGNEEGPCEYTFREITSAVDVQQGMIARSVLLDLLNSAQLLGADDTEALSGVLYPKNSDLRVAAGAAVKERLWAAWYYLNARYSLTEIAKDSSLFDCLKSTARELAAVLGANDPQYITVKETMKKVFEAKK